MLSSKKAVVVYLALFIFSILSIVLSNWEVENSTEKFIYTDLTKIPANRVGMLLGTSRHLNNGQNNPFFYNRIKAAAALYFSGKIRYILVSGDNRFYSYNEPREMRRELMRAGIPDTCIVMDFAGFRTLDSVVRAKKVFGLNNITIISQEFHNERAIYIARYYNMDAVAYNAIDPSGNLGMQVQLREYLARAKMIIDLHVLRLGPYFLGAPIKIGKT
jgi:SanA protein